MANVIIKNDDRARCAEKIMEQYGVDKRDPAMREAAYATAAIQDEAIKKAETRRYYG
ncbi:MAG: hypothetical protein IJ733_21420 [Lachnospiraceae bacterium]|nr:hypothetical protein [Lachnospiraceae bacterium]